MRGTVAGRGARGRSAAAAVILAAGAATAAAQGPALVRTEGWRHLIDPGPVDPGVGVAAFPSPRHATWADTLPLFTRPGDGRPAGRFVFASDSSRGWVYVLEWPDTLITNALEYGYEDVGLPVDTVTPDSAWVRVIAGFTTAGAPARAWVPLRPGLALVWWRERLPEHDLFFRQGVTAAFFESPEGRTVSFTIPASGDYILHPLEMRGAWMRVRAVTPSDMCDDPPSPSVAELWIRVLDPAGRPLVWYHTRGC